VLWWASSRFACTCLEMLLAGSNAKADHMIAAQIGLPQVHEMFPQPFEKHSHRSLLGRLRRDLQSTETSRRSLHPLTVQNVWPCHKSRIW
jgi:hypothetical protein